jgi:phosphonate transport system ATP-binding protein
MLEINGLIKRLGSKTAVDNVTIVVGKHPMIEIIGKCRAGKSTMLRMLNRPTSETKGQIVFEGRNITSLTGAQRRAIAQPAPIGVNTNRAPVAAG